MTMTRTPGSGSRPAPSAPRGGSSSYVIAPILAIFFVALVGLDLLITGIGSPPSIVPPVQLGENTGVPVVPSNADFPYSHTHTIWAIVLLGGLGTVGFLLCVREVIKNNDWLPLFTSIGTVIIVVPEVFVDIIGMVYYPTSDSDHAFDLFGRQMGWFILAGWFGAGAFAVTMTKALLLRPTAKQVWILMGATCLSYTIFEEFLVGFGGIYHYYGNQPMWWHNLPLWWTPCNAIGCALLPAAFAYRYQALLKGWKAAAMLVVVPASVAGAYAFIGMPSWVVVNGDYAWFPTELAGLGTWALAIGLVAIILNLFLGYQPFSPDSKPWTPPGVDEDIDDAAVAG